ncbi:MAG: tetratricopeptide repeat protein [Myxococcales bacterium]|nr:tetratricopeptide repeat protein [Myxococcales bacterium]
MPAWGEPQRAAVEQALRAASPEPAAGAWETTAAGLDAYATAWRDAKARACEATRVERVAGEELLELRMACLDRRALQVAATVELLSEADGSTAAHAAQAVRSLPEVEPCLDVERLRRTPPLPPSLEHQAEQIRGLVARSWAFDAAGQALRGLEAAQQAIEGARALGDEGASLEAEARLNRGRMYRAIRRLADARDDLEAVLQHAERGADEALALDALQELLRVAQDEDDGSAFGAWMTVARGKLAARADEPRAEARLHYLEGLQALRDEQFARAEASLEQAVEAHRRLGPAASLDTGRALIELGRARARLHHDEQAEQTFARAQALAEGEGLLPLLADVIQERGQLCFDRGRSDEAERWLRRSLELRVGLHGPTAPVTIPPRVQLAMLLQQRGEHEAALAMVDAVRDDLGPEVPDHSRMQVMYLLARVHRQQGDWQAALDDYRRVEQIMAELPTPDPVEQAMLHSSVADCLRVLQRPEAARSRYERAIEALHVHADRDDFRLVYPLYGLASLLDEQGDTVGARNLYRRALQIHQDAPRDREVGAMLHWKLARAGLTGRPEPGPQPERQQALQHLQQARQQYQALGDAEMVAQIDAFRDECGSACLAPSQSR